MSNLYHGVVVNKIQMVENLRGKSMQVFSVIKSQVGGESERASRAAGTHRLNEAQKYRSGSNAWILFLFCFKHTNCNNMVYLRQLQFEQ